MESLNSIRQTFIQYFEKLGHRAIKSSPLVPRNDPTLMFTNAGMVQFKNLFTGIESTDYKRAVTSQKCVRAGGKHNDLDNVGYTARHHTFFEMLGNFSFGDYFKEEAIPFAWDLLTKEFGLDSQKLVVTIFHDDDAAASIWKKYTGISDNRIIRINSSDNFWSMGATGPCGPCSEIFYDHGSQVKGGPPGSRDEDGDRFIEIWNLVFMQFEQFENGERKDLPRPSIDTGMGLERLGAVLQGKHDNYETNTMRVLIEASAEATSVEAFGKSNAHHRVIADHLRSSAFLIADGVSPSNEGRGYVLRRIMRRAMRHVHLLGVDHNLMHLLVPTLIKEMGQAFPELQVSQKNIEDTLFLEESKFKVTLDRGMKLLDNKVRNLPDRGTLQGSVAFELYDTFGFPLDLTQDALREKGLSVDVNGFNEAMSEQKQKARAAWVGAGFTDNSQLCYDLYDEFGGTEFLGYESQELQAKLLVIVNTVEKVERIKKGAEAFLIFNQTPFYALSGGQVSDEGLIISKTGKAVVTKVTKTENIFLHSCKIVEGFFSIHDECQLQVDRSKRKIICANHSATHLMHEALRQVLGDHIAQKGSLNDSDRLRFDFNHPRPVSESELLKVEEEVNKYIRQNSKVHTRIMEAEEAIKYGARALFSEKYGKEVRVVSMGIAKNSEIGMDGAEYSVELCGGTHVKMTGEIAIFKVVSESASASGVRRIEALTGVSAFGYLASCEKELLRCSRLLKSKHESVYSRVSFLLEEVKNLTLKLDKLKRGDNSIGTDAFAIKKSDIESVGKFLLFSKVFDEVSGKELRPLLDRYKKELGEALILLIGVKDNKLSIIAGVSDSLTAYISSVDIVQIMSQETGGKGGGGRPDMAQAGGSEPAKVKKAISSVRTYLKNIP